MSLEQSKILSQLKENNAYPHPVYNIKVLETHISWIFLTGPFTYKINRLNLAKFWIFQIF